MALTLSEGRMFGAMYESILYGINFILFLTMFVLVHKDPGKNRSLRIRAMIISVIFVLCTVHLAAVMRGAFLAFFRSSSSDDFFNNHTEPMDLIQKSVYALANVLSDGLIIHRLWLISGGSWLAIVAPCLILCSTTGLWIALIRTYALSPPGSTLYAPQILSLAPAAFGTSFLTNLVITCFILFYILRATRNAKLTGTSGTFYMRLIACTVESGLLYPLCLLITGALLLVKNNGLEILSGSNTQLLCIVPILLTIQMRLKLSLYDVAMAFKQGGIETDTPIDPGLTMSVLHFGAPAQDRSTLGQILSNPSMYGTSTGTRFVSNTDLYATNRSTRHGDTLASNSTHSKGKTVETSTSDGSKYIIGDLTEEPHLLPDKESRKSGEHHSVV